MASGKALRGKGLVGNREYAEGSFYLPPRKNIFKKKKQFPVKVLSSPMPYSGPATVKQDASHLSTTGIDSKYVFAGRVLDPKMTHNKLLNDPCDEATTDDPAYATRLQCMHTQITLSKAGSRPDFEIGDVLICRFFAGDNSNMYDLQNAEFVKVKDKFKNKKSGKDSAKVSSVCEKASQSFAGADFSKLGQTIPAGAHSFGAALGGAATAGAGAPMLTSAQSCGDTDAAPANWAQDTLYYIISKKEKSKKFTDVIPLDGGSIGIAHFAAGGLNSLYDAMGDETAKKYFGKTVSQLKSFSRGKNKCKGTTPMSKNDNGTGCYSVGWWKSGMEKFTASPESRAIQTKAWMDSKAGPGSERAKAHGWTTARQFAIAAGISNSMGVGGFTKLAEKVGWDAEKVLIGYTQGITIPSANDANKRHWTRRANLINSTFPCKNITTTPKADSTTVADTTESNTGEPPVDSGTTQAPT